MSEPANPPKTTDSAYIDAGTKQLLERMAATKQRPVAYIVRMLVEREARRMGLPVR